MRSGKYREDDVGEEIFVFSVKKYLRRFVSVIDHHKQCREKHFEHSYTRIKNSVQIFEMVEISCKDRPKELKEQNYRNYKLNIVI